MWKIKVATFLLQVKFICSNTIKISDPCTSTKCARERKVETPLFYLISSLSDQLTTKIRNGMRVTADMWMKTWPLRIFDIIYRFIFPQFFLYFMVIVIINTHFILIALFILFRKKDKWIEMDGTVFWCGRSCPCGF